MQRGRGARGIECLDEQPPVADFAGGTRPHKPSQLPIDRAPGVQRLLAEDLDRAQLTLAVEQIEDGIDTEGADERILEIGDAGEESEPVEGERLVRVTFVGWIVEGVQCPAHLIGPAPGLPEYAIRQTARLRTFRWRPRGDSNTRHTV
jgi:hypothetical protein